MRYALLLAVCVPLGACIPSAPIESANTTALDEKAGILAETLYTTASRLGAIAVRAGALDEAKFKDLDNRAYLLLGLARSAYRAGNAAQFDQAVRELNSIIASLSGAAS